MAKSSIQKRRRIRELETKRDKLMEASFRYRMELQKIRAELKSARKAPA